MVLCLPRGRERQVAQPFAVGLVAVDKLLIEDAAAGLFNNGSRVVEVMHLIRRQKKQRLIPNCVGGEINLMKVLPTQSE